MLWCCDAIDREKLRERMDRFDIPTGMSLNEIRAALKDPLRDGYQ